MIFKRTSSGISNQYLFHNVDFVIFVEGGKKSYNYNDVCKGKCSENSTDIAFWNNIFQAYHIGKKIKFKSIGSKSTAREIAKEISQNKIQNTIVALDRDYDTHLGKITNYPKILYSHGYSWENDLWSKNIILQIINKIGHFPQIPASLIQKVELTYETFIKKIKRHIIIDIISTNSGISYIPKNSGEEILLILKKLPSINTERLKQLLSKINKEKKNKLIFKKKLTISPEKDCYGKLIKSFGYFILKWLGNKLKSFSTLSKDMADCLLLSHMETTFRSPANKQVDDYYQNMLNTLQKAL